jgi:hypothetical protein
MQPESKIPYKAGILDFMLMLNELHKRGYDKLRWYSAEYKDENKDDIEKRTNDVTRAYIVYDHGKVYDLSIPISFFS